MSVIEILGWNVRQVESFCSLAGLQDHLQSSACCAQSIWGQPVLFGLAFAFRFALMLL